MGGMKFEFWWAGKLIFWEGGGIKFEFWWVGFNCADWTVHLIEPISYAVTPGSSDSAPTQRAREAREFDGTGRKSKVSFKNLHTLWVYR